MGRLRQILFIIGQLPTLLIFILYGFWKSKGDISVYMEYAHKQEIHCLVSGLVAWIIILGIYFKLF